MLSIFIVYWYIMITTSQLIWLWLVCTWSYANLIKTLVATCFTTKQQNVLQNVTRNITLPAEVCNICLGATVNRLASRIGIFRDWQVISVLKWGKWVLKSCSNCCASMIWKVFEIGVFTVLRWTLIHVLLVCVSILWCQYFSGEMNNLKIFHSYYKCWYVMI